VVGKQAQVNARAQVVLALLKNVVMHADEEPENSSNSLMKLAEVSRRVLDRIEER